MKVYQRKLLNAKNKKVEVNLSKALLVIAIVMLLFVNGLKEVKHEWEAYISNQVDQTCTIENMYEVNDVQSIEC